MNWLDVLGSHKGPYQFDLDMPEGTRFEAKPPYPDFTVNAAKLTPVRRLVCQEVDGVAYAAERDKSEPMRIIRVVAELEDNRRVEISRVAVAIEVVPTEDIDISRCAGCGRTIPKGDHIIYENQAYHRNCIEEDDDE